jgi:hypothetical protein
MARRAFVKFGARTLFLFRSKLNLGCGARKSTAADPRQVPSRLRGNASGFDHRS